MGEGSNDTFVVAVLEGTFVALVSLLEDGHASAGGAGGNVVVALAMRVAQRS
jgi:hypothetical protein